MMKSAWSTAELRRVKEMSDEICKAREQPRSGRTLVQGYAWLARLSDKARAAHQGTIARYFYPSDTDFAVLECWNLTVSEFDRAVLEYPDDTELAAWLEGRVTAEARECGNRWVFHHSRNNAALI
jgi:hypothetical protein